MASGAADNIGDMKTLRLCVAGLALVTCLAAATTTAYGGRVYATFDSQTIVVYDVAAGTATT